MSKPKEKTTDKNALVTSTETKLPASLAAQIKADAGKGLSKDSADNLVPLVYVLQSGSPQVKKGDPARIEGAEEGDIWLRNAADPIIKGEDGILFQPCYFSKDWVEWMPDRGGFVGRHAELPADAEKVEDEDNPNRVSYVRKNGNDVVETRYHVGYVLRAGHDPEPFVIPFSSTGHTVSRQWMSAMNSKNWSQFRTHLASLGQAASWGCLYRLKTRRKTNADGSWFLFSIDSSEFIDIETPDGMQQYERGTQLNSTFASGTKQAEAPAERSNEDKIPF